MIRFLFIVATAASLIVINLTGPTRRKWLITAAVAVTGLLYADILALWATQPHGYLHTWGVFHYYLNGKYFDELGYFDLYACALAAGPWPEEVKQVRLRSVPVGDLRTYRLVAPARAGVCPRHRFSPGRWAAFKADVAFLQGHPPVPG